MIFQGILKAICWLGTGSLYLSFRQLLCNYLP
jgi:hypothetical protein